VGEPGEAGAARALSAFLKTGLKTYADDRDRPDRPGTSRLSPHLHFGEISPWRAWTAAYDAAGAGGILEAQADKFTNELIWREFSAHLLHHFPTLATDAFRPDYDRMPWINDAGQLRAWMNGQTGYPVVDAGMRELWATGYMHNRVRMVAASFLIKHLLIPWQRGAAWFWDTLLDADLANNSASWQWVAGSGADAAPYFRIFNPIMQGEKFDPEGIYIRRWIPELKDCPDRFIQRPWEAPEFTSLRYPAPIVEHTMARDRALKAFQSLPKAE
jgi:deoxyribodipyrimidine photo-lyase